MRCALYASVSTNDQTPDNQLLELQQYVEARGWMASIAEFERARIQERIHAGLARARAQGKQLGRPRAVALPSGAPSNITIHQAAGQWRVSKSTAARRLATGWTPDMGKTPAAGG